MLDNVLNQLKAESEAAGKGAFFASLLPYLTGAQDRLPYATLAPNLGLSEAALKMAIHRLRTRYGELLRKEIAQTVATPSEVDEEIRYLLSILARTAN